MNGKLAQGNMSQVVLCKWHGSLNAAWAALVS